MAAAMVTPPHGALPGGMGLIPRTGPNPHPALAPVTGAGPLPAVVDTRSQYLLAFDQGQHNTCTANSFAAMVEHQLIRQHVSVPYHRSRLYPYFYSWAGPGPVQDTGRAVDDVLNAIMQHGIPPEKDWPYTPNTTLAVTPSAAAQKAADRRHIVKASHIPPDPFQLMAALAAGYSVGLCTPIFESFARVQAAVVPMPKAGETLWGYHQMTIGGYTTIALPGGIPAGSYLVLNSWGTNFGAAGWCWLPMAWIGASVNGIPLTQELIAVELVTP